MIELYLDECMREELLNYDLAPADIPLAKYVKNN